MTCDRYRNCEELKRYENEKAYGCVGRYPTDANGDYYRVCLVRDRVDPEVTYTLSIPQEDLTLHLNLGDIGVLALLLTTALEDAKKNL